MVPKEIHNLQTRIIQFTDQKKKLKTYIKARIELSINESTKRPRIYIIVQVLDLSEICRMI